MSPPGIRVRRSLRVATTLRRYANHIRRALTAAGGNGAWLDGQSRPSAFCLDIGPALVDYHRFLRFTDSAHDARDPDRFDEALTLWRAIPLADLHGDWAERRRVDMRNRYLTARHQRFQALLDTGRADRVRTELPVPVENHPTEQFLLDGARALAALEPRGSAWSSGRTLVCHLTQNARASDGTTDREQQSSSR